MRRLRGGELASELGPVIARVVAIAAIVLAVLAVAIVVTRPTGTYEVNAIFDSSRGLIEGGDVTAGFQRVGTVDNITLGKDDGLPHVRMRIDGDYVLHQGAFADIRLSSNVGAVNRVVDLKQGDPSAPRLSDGATLGPSSTDEPVDFDTAISTLDPKTRRAAGSLLAGLDAATRGRGADIDRLLRHSSGALNQTANVLGELSSDRFALRSAVANTRTVVGALAANPNALGSAAERTATLLRVAGRRQNELRRVARSIGPAAGYGRLALQNLDRSIPGLRRLVRGARPVVTRLAPVAKSLPGTIKPLRGALAQARKLVEAGPGNSRRLRPAVETALPLLVALEPTLRELNPVLDQGRVRSPEAVGFFGLFGDALSNFDVNGHVVRYIPRLIQLPPDQTLLGPSDTGRGSLARPFDRTPGALEGDPWNGYASSFIGGGRPTSDYYGSGP
ncbi:MAG: phospholipid/cholesterol/gamma-HCH transport system substrate-binding protein [Solirubrobacterales bacterium]|jgi:phospholipid/cholesterol/gamma-HCH transport system substrate-binding protein|nr:phospholipid/cholesterol/gamma-HCH transport system substrate-binding protein [Solirubrobacterales bacterium]